jgi:cobalt-zinc-cadmium efflux system membrane fusion protein
MPARLSQHTQAAIVAGGVLVAALGYVLLPPAGGSPADPPQAVSAPGQPRTYRPTKAEWTRLETAVVAARSFRPAAIADGTIAIDDDLATPVFSPYSGRVVRLIAKAGDHVDKGMPLMAVEATEFVQGQNDLISALAALSTARAQLTLTEAAEKRQHQLYLANGAALKDWQQSQADLAAAQSGVRSSEIALAAARNRLRILGKSDSDIAAIERAPTQRMDPTAYVFAPIGGTVTQRQVGLGQNIQSVSGGASNPVYTIGDLSIVWLIANVREEDAPLVRLGEPVEVTVPAYPGRIFRAKVSFIAASVDPNIHMLPVRADVANPDGALKPVMLAHFRIMTGPAAERPAVPEEAIVHRGEEQWVWVVGPDGTLAAREIGTGEVRDGLVEVTGGLAAGAKIVTGGSLFVDRAARGE